MERDFSQDIRINRFKLDEECEQHSSNYYYWAEQLSDAKKDADAAKDKLKLVLAEQETMIRENAKKSGAKITEAGVSAELEQDEAVQVARRNLRVCQSTQYHLEAGISALEHKKKMLDNLVQLWMKSYYSAPGRTATDEGSDDIRKQLNNKGGE